MIKNSTPTFLNDKIIKIITDYIKDRANAVRKEATKLIILIIDCHG